ncbi:MAG: ABC transporter permease [Porphyromonas sp.]|nr:ABC transporter permease [Porphyromonas sp.]
MNKFWIVFKKEYLIKVRKRSFIIATILVPILMMALVMVPLLLSMTARDTSEKKVMVVDHTGKYFDTIASESSDGFVFVDDNNLNVAEIRKSPNDDYYAYVVITDDLLENPRALTIYSHKAITPALEKHIYDVLPEQLRTEKIASYDIPELNQIIEDTKVNITISTVQWSSSGDEKETSTTVAMVIGQIFNFAIFLFVIMYGSMVMTSVKEEKQSRIVEIIASSVKPTTLLSAKIAGIGCVGLTQVLIWGVLLVGLFLGLQGVFLNSATFDFNQLASTAQASDVDPELIQDLLIPLANFNFGKLFFAFIFYFICGYISYASLFAALGAATDSDEDLQQVSAPISLFMVFGFYVALYSVENPNGPLPLVCSFLPFVAPGVMMVRLPFDPPTIQVVLSAVIMIVTTVLLVWMSAKVFRVGLLMYGKKPKLKEMIRWIRFS